MQEISTKIQDLKISALAGFVDELVPVLESQGFTIDEFWLALSVWAEQNGRNESAVYLEQAANLLEHLEQAVQ